MMNVCIGFLTLIAKVGFFNPRGDGKYPIVIAVILVVFLGLGATMIYLEKHLRKIEKHQQELMNK